VSAKIEVECANCGKKLYRIPYHIKHNLNHFCNCACMGKWRIIPEEDKKKNRKKYVNEWQKKNSDKCNLYARRWRKKNPEKARELYRKCSSTPKARETSKIWWANNIERRREYDRKRRLSPSYRINDAMSGSIREALKREKGNSHWCDLVGYTLNDLKKHLEPLFTEGMTWNNYGKWHIDHIIPKSVFNFTKPEHDDFKRCWDLSNLQPLWAKENLSKHAKLIEHFQPSLLLEV